MTIHLLSKGELILGLKLCRNILVLYFADCLETIHSLSDSGLNLLKILHPYFLGVTAILGHHVFIEEFIGSI